MPAADRSHRDLILRLVKENGWTRGAELGLSRGLLFGRLLRECPGLRMIGVDTFRRPHRRALVMGIANEFSDRCVVHACTTTEAAGLVEDDSLDFVFIDAGHGYEAVRDDIRNWSPKVKAGGWLLGHDYDRDRHPGVVQAVDEAFGRVNLLGHTVWQRAQ